MAATETAAHDVTGGIEAKVQVCMLRVSHMNFIVLPNLQWCICTNYFSQAAVGMAQLGRHVEVYIVQAGSDSALQALRGEVPTFGTLIALK